MTETQQPDRKPGIIEPDKAGITQSDWDRDRVTVLNRLQDWQTELDKLLSQRDQLSSRKKLKEVF